ncbi:hypothetical protein OG897_06385 [Streptomyces sp. NBC_00237]|uniref:hypothetical protein n=1 Tax=Streptomyces sp. NBC_00237 TaxID=2975687 RepID=UPI00225A3E27|nr:hypothetical protein [Streptomyces sp. NBC_00237]MCX5201090.1 hypothetical protein [Streptomyces sp. NBC_00237]
MSAHRVSAATGVIRAAMEQGHTAAEELAAALEVAQLLQDPDTAARTAALQEQVLRRHAAAEVTGQLVLGLGRDITAFKARIAELESAPTVIYRAEHPEIGLVLGTYATQDAACKHCEAMLGRRDSEHLLITWVPDDGDPLPPVELCVGDDVVRTGYLVTPLEIDASYDEEADE